MLSSTFSRPSRMTSHKRNPIWSLPVAWNKDNPTHKMTDIPRLNSTTNWQSSTPSLRTSTRPAHCRSVSSPSISFTFLFQSLTLDTGAAAPGLNQPGLPSPTRLRLLKRFSGTLPGKMDKAAAQSALEVQKEAARRQVKQHQYGK